MKNIKMYCVTNKILNLLDDSNYNLGWVGNEEPPKNYILCNDIDNIFYKEKYYSELTFQYWYWKNELNINDDSWIGFCQKRRYWVNKNSAKVKLDNNNFRDHILVNAQEEWNNYDAIISLNAIPIGVSTQPVDDLKEMVTRLGVSYDIVSLFITLLIDKI